MTSIKWPTAAGGLTGLTTGISGGLRTDGQSAGVSPLARVQTEFQQASAGQLSLRLGGTLASNLDTALRRLSDAASSFAWPTVGIPFATQSRFAVVPPERAADLQATLPDASGILQEDKFLSRGFTASSPTSLAPGTFTMNLGFGGKTDKLSVTVTAGETNKEVLQAVAAAVNGSTLQVDASVRSQTGVGILGPDVLPTGSFLALSVNRTRADDTPTLTDTSGHLAAALSLTATASPDGPAELGEHQLTSLSLARPTVFRSTGFDTNAPTTLPPGIYTVAYAAGPTSGSVLSGSVDLHVNAGDTWGDVLRRMRTAFGSASASLVSELVPARRVWDSTTDEKHAVVDAQGLTIQLNEPKPGWRLSLSGGNITGGGSGNILSALGLNTTAQPGSDGRMVIDGRDQTRTPGTFIADQGRVVLDQSGTFGEIVPVSVIEPLNKLSQGLTDVVTAYNGLRDVLTKNADLLRPGLAEDWRQPVVKQAASLRDLGLVESGRDKLLWFQAKGLVQALTTDPEAVRQTLLGNGKDEKGLLPTLASMAQDELKAGATSLLLPQSSFAQRDPFLASPTPRTESEIEKASQLLDLLDSAPKIAPKSASGLVSGLASGAPPQPFPWEGGPGLLRRKG